jgi:hypothetical protein
LNWRPFERLRPGLTLPPICRSGLTKTGARSQNPVTFFKHAKKKETYEVSEQWTELYLFDAVMAYTSLADDRSAAP